MSFIKESMKEFDHIVWPTSEETRKYFITVVSMITALTVLLFIVGTLLSTGLFEAKKQLVPVQSVPVTTNTAPIGDLKIDGLETTTTPVTTPPAVSTETATTPTK